MISNNNEKEKEREAGKVFLIINLLKVTFLFK